MRNEILILRVLVVVLTILTLLSLTLDIWIFLKQETLQKHLEGNKSIYEKRTSGVTYIFV